MSFDALAESCKSLLAMPTVCPNTGSIPAVSGTSVDVDKPPSFQFVSGSPKIERKPLAAPVMFGPNITGSAKMDKNASGFPVIFYGSGALSVSTRTISENVAYYNTSGVTPVEGVLSFSARSSNSIYSGSTVQPSAIRLMLCIKT